MDFRMYEIYIFVIFIVILSTIALSHIICAMNVSCGIVVVVSLILCTATLIWSVYAVSISCAMTISLFSCVIVTWCNPYIRISWWYYTDICVEYSYLWWWYTKISSGLIKIKCDRTCLRWCGWYSISTV